MVKRKPMLSRYAFCAISIQSTLSHGKNEGARYTNMPMYQQLCVGYTPRLFILVWRVRPNYRTLRVARAVLLRIGRDCSLYVILCRDTFSSREVPRLDRASNLSVFPVFAGDPDVLGLGHLDPPLFGSPTFVGFPWVWDAIALRSSLAFRETEWSLSEYGLCFFMRLLYLECVPQ